MRVLKTAALTLWVVVWVTFPAFANPGYGYTDIYAPPGSEKTHAQILGEDIYGGTFTADGNNYVGSGASAGITAIRVYDFDDMFDFTTHVYNHTPEDVDQIWTDGVVTVTAYARYAAYQQSFGWNDGAGTVGTNFIKLLDWQDVETGHGETFEIAEGQQFLWGLQVNGDGRCTGYYQEWWSKESENGWCLYEEDHMVTYYMEGASASEAVWVVFWEDVKLTGGSDRDYNDFVVEIRAVPEPLTLGLLAVGALFLRKRKK
jgi:hypothetical protein